MNSQTGRMILFLRKQVAVDCRAQPDHFGNVFIGHPQLKNWIPACIVNGF